MPCRRRAPTVRPWRLRPVGAPARRRALVTSVALHLLRRHHVVPCRPLLGSFRCSIVCRPVIPQLDCPSGRSRPASPCAPRGRARGPDLIALPAGKRHRIDVRSPLRVGLLERGRARIAGLAMIDLVDRRRPSCSCLRCVRSAARSPSFASTCCASSGVKPDGASPSSLPPGSTGIGFAIRAVRTTCVRPSPSVFVPRTDSSKPPSRHTSHGSVSPPVYRSSTFTSPFSSTTVFVSPSQSSSNADVQLVVIHRPGHHRVPVLPRDLLVPDQKSQCLHLITPTPGNNRYIRPD